MLDNVALYEMFQDTVFMGKSSLMTVCDFLPPHRPTPRAVLEDDPFTRMKEVVRWYLSGFYKKPKGLKKPYNPILGETFRCYWRHPNGSRTFYVAEQVREQEYVAILYTSMVCTETQSMSTK